MNKKYLVLIFFVTFTSSILATTLTLEEAISIALTNSYKQKISQQDQAIAKARYNQALSGNYPFLDISALANKADDDFIDKVDDDIAVEGLPQPMSISYTHTIMGTDTAIARADLTYALYTGGKLSALQEQATQGMHYAEESSKLTEDDIVLHVKKYYAASILSEQLLELTQESADRMEAIKDLTEAFYQGESLSVKKTDYLRTKMMLFTIKSMLEEMKEKVALSKSALLFEMGEKQDKELELSSESLHVKIIPKSLQMYYEAMYFNSHQLKQTQIALRVRDAQIEEAKSDYLPSLGLYANAMTLYNNHDGGMINSRNNDSWNVGIALKYNLFSGGLTQYRIEEAKAEKLKLEAQSSYLKSGLSLQAKKAFLSLTKSTNQGNILKEAVEVSAENRSLNFRAYQEDLVPTKDVIEAQIFESITKASYYKARYEALVSKSELDYIIGKSL
jgi:outer membrane protein TolC